MFYQPYRHYLEFLETKVKSTILQKSVLIFFSMILIVLGAISSFTYWQYQRSLPLKLEHQYLEIASGSFLSTKQSLNEIIDNFQVLGSKVKVLDEFKDNPTASSEFLIPLEDVTKTIANIENIKENFLFQKDQLQKLDVPQKFQNLQIDLVDFYNEASTLLESLHSQQKFTQDMLLSLGPNFYLPVLTNESLWNAKKTEDIIAYYQNIKEEANKTLANLAHLDVPIEFKSYHKSQIIYLELLVNTSSQIVDILSQQDDPQNPDITQIEKAYQVLTTARRENETISQELLSKRLNLLSKETNSAKFAPVKIKQNSLEAKLEDIYINQPQDKPVNTLENIWKSTQKFFRGLQIPSLI